MTTLCSKTVASLTVVLWVFVGVLGLDHCHSHHAEGAIASVEVAVSADHDSHHSHDGDDSQDCHHHVGPSNDHLALIPLVKSALVMPTVFVRADFLPLWIQSCRNEIPEVWDVPLLCPLALRPGTLCLRL